MLNLAGLPKKFGFIGIAILAVSSLVLNAAAPRGWLVAGSKPTEYEAGVDAQAVYGGRTSAYLKSKRASVEGFGTLMQEFRADQYVGKRIRLSAFVKAEEVNSWAGLWMRVDKCTTSVAFDNMQDRPIKGTTGWQRHELVLDVPQNGTGIFFGILLEGAGSVWLNNVKFEVVGPQVPTSGAAGAQLPDTPTNLDFKEQ